ncbi:Uncharacterized protein PECH_007000 [Penicillium ucsense]|uniref:Galactose oxidase/kelch, beta-propeller n=1 Tax=Penicillium ucsense TaxID=2839758 RepID=A0A8J8W496_9EURO|nr:Uncharacterized protein PECM_006841 [Penicillium ucsense]KAF7735206.1 Uncharacterized protein PECH_007000 [Penicillium ucsense]
MKLRRGCQRSPIPHAALLFALFNKTTTALVYTPSSAFLSPSHDNALVYVLQPSTTLDHGIEFLSLNVSRDLDVQTPKYETLLPKVPFQNAEQNSTFTPVIDASGVISIYAGNCQDGATARDTLWQFQPDNTSAIGNGSWTQSDVVSTERLVKPKYLAASFSFTSSRSGAPTFYSFGGMCPFANSTGDRRVSAANYSQSMVMINQDPTQDSKYSAQITGNRAPPVPEAGMSAVALLETKSRTQTQQDFLFIGGHTQQAFLNMSELAIFSVPQNSWTFVTVDSEPTARTELAIRGTQMVEPRSGHAVALSQDGTKVFVVGGWVGDTSTPADPQLAILNIGEEYGGAGPWTWTVPSQTGTGVAAGTGLFGHSVVMLPGDVLMISGGYIIPRTSSSKRASSLTERNSQVYLFNTSSSSWMTSYSNPNVKIPPPTSRHHGLSSTQKLSLGLGIGLGLPLAVVIAICACGYLRKRAIRNRRDSQLRDLALGAERAHFWTGEERHQSSSIRSSQMTERQNLISVTQPWSSTRSSASRPLSWDEHRDGNAERTGLLADPSSPTKPASPVSQPRAYQPLNFAEYRRSELSEIHPIDECDEDEAMSRERLMSDVRHEPGAVNEETKDVFRDDPLSTPRPTIFGVGLGPFYSRRKDNGSGSDGRASPATKSERTSTNLSDSSGFSFCSATAKPTGQVPQARPVLVEHHSSLGSHGAENLITSTPHSDGDLPAAPSEKSSTESYSTAQTNFSHRQGEIEGLLHDNNDFTSPITPRSASPSKLPPGSKPKASDWMMNTVRRALTLTRRGGAYSQADAEDDSTAYRASGIDQRSTYAGLGVAPTGSSSNSPRRTVSASAELFRRKQGARDWNARKRLSEVPFSMARGTRDDLFIGAPGYLGDDDTCDDPDDWDVEGAAEGRSVQMTYTVPREKLRVVNASARDMDGISERSTSGGFRRVSDSISSRRVSR